METDKMAAVESAEVPHAWKGKNTQENYPKGIGGFKGRKKDKAPNPGNVDRED